MPSIRVLSWNIQQLGTTKVNVPGLMRALGRVIADAKPDVAIIVEVAASTALSTMTTLSAWTNDGCDVRGKYLTWMASHPTGGECYGVLIRDLAEVRPVHVTGDPNGTSASPLVNLDANRFSTWPGPFAGPAPRIPLCQVFASTEPDGRVPAHFAGQPRADGGLALGRGSRLPGLVMVVVASLPRPRLVPIVVNHLGAVPGGRNHQASGQIHQLVQLDIAQRFSAKGFVSLDGAAVRVEEIVFTGDFNVDFLENAEAGTHQQTMNRKALAHLTPTSAGGGSAGPPAPPAVPLPAAPVPFPPVPPATVGPRPSTIPDLALRAAITNRSTMLPEPSRPLVPPAVPPACFDNFFYGGTALFGVGAPAPALTPGARPAPGVAGETGVIKDVQEMVEQRDLDLGPVWMHYRSLTPRKAGDPLPQKRRWADMAPNLHPLGGAPTATDQLVGARFLSDHLPTLIEVVLP